MSEVWILIDANNFFVSCERVFRPDLERRPVLVLSCNDGCVVSRSQEVKDLGVAMGVPKFQIEDKIKQYNIMCFSSNFRLYGDLSSRMMATIRGVVGGENQEIYSIDECFVHGTYLGVKNWEKWAIDLREKIKKELGLPVTVGVARTKTLAKLAVEVAKHDFLGKGVMMWLDENYQEQYLAGMKITQVWGIGGGSARKLLEQGIKTVEQLRQMPEPQVDKLLGLVGVRTWQELNEISCIAMTEAPVGRRQILRSRSFGQAVYKLAELRQAVGEFMQTASDNMRRHGWRASMVTVFIRTSNFVEQRERYANAMTIGLEESTSYLPELMAAADKALRAIYRENFAYKKAGVILNGLEDERGWQPKLLGETAEIPIAEEKKQAVMRAVEKLNFGYGAHKVGVGMSGENAMAGAAGRAKWRTRATQKSPEYLTSWEELAQVQ